MAHMNDEDFALTLLVFHQARTGLSPLPYVLNGCSGVMCVYRLRFKCRVQGSYDGAVRLGTKRHAGRSMCGCVAALQLLT